MKKIGIITCSTVTQDLACSSFNCLKEMTAGDGEFAVYNGQVQLAGIISCAGCGASMAREKLLRRIRSLTHLHVEVIHLSTCMIHLCPFHDKYYKLLMESFPQIRFVKGTHGAPAGVPEGDFKSIHREMVRGLIRQGQTMSDIIALMSGE